MNQFFQQFDNNLKGYDTQNNLNNNWNWNYFEEDKKQKSPSKSFNVNEFMNTDFYNKNDMRVDGNKTNRFDTDGTMNTNFTQTTYSVKDEGLHTTANGTKWNGNKTRVHNNAIQYHDDSYGWCDIYAVNINQVKEHGTGKASVYNSKLHGSVMEVHHKDGSVSNGIILDACGIASKKPVIDKWVYNQEKENEQVDWFIKRQGWDK